MQFLKHSLACGAAIAALSSPVLAHDHQTSRGRLVFADHAQPKVYVLDLDSGEVTDSFDVPRANPSFSATENGRYVVITTGEPGIVKFLDTGLSFESHDDHMDIDKGKVRMLDFTLSGDKPSHVVSENGWVAVAFDGVKPWERASDPKAVFIKLDSLSKAKPVTKTWKSPAPQHGIAVPLGGDRFLVSTPNEAYAKGDQSASSRSNGFEILDGKSWKVTASFNDLSDAARSCKAYHGHGSSNGVHVFGCAEGVKDDPKSGGMLALVKQGKNAWQARRIAYADERRTSTIKGRDEGSFMVGNYGSKSPYDALVRIDPKKNALTSADVLPLPGGQAVCKFELSQSGRHVASLTADGKLRVFEIAPAWKEVASFDAVPAFDCAYGARTPTPSLAVIGDNAFVSDPVNKRIREYSFTNLKQGLDIPVDAVPANIAPGKP
ncbi:hypothetical protein MHY87_13865 [Microvirga sp. ACRRW]|uniref:hypothetical protein n=1 Tax=Microvirga sp. ACRRW TaxID=2918205 RepID=UPI001EF4E488|nr:hypothetical protein [Microvirga sp. ACRRW]MCG7393993.1 hypothetical protein [Microvirga sp. ACRRW]